MNKKDREIKDKAEILDVLDRCDTIRLGLFNREYPYVVPVSFGLDLDQGKTVIYIHGTQKGLKADCIAQNQKVCVEADIFYKVEPWQMGITARYESIIGFGEISKVDEDEEKIYGLKRILAHYHYSDHPVDQCKSLSHANVYKIVLRSITGKRNLPDT